MTTLQDCHNCTLRDTCKAPVPGEGPANCVAMLIGEAPGRDENAQGRPFVGRTGTELDAYLKKERLTRDRIFITNTIRCKPPKDRDPRPEEIEACLPWLLQELRQHNPIVIGLMGKVAVNTLLGPEYNLFFHHGLPVRPECGPLTGKLVLPLYHPASGLHSIKQMVNLAYDFHALAQTLRGEIQPGDIKDEYLEPRYGRITCTTELEIMLFQQPEIYVDTETVDGQPWCLSFSTEPGTAFVVMAEDRDLIEIISERLAAPSVTTILHNAMFDLLQLSRLGIYPAKVIDSMIAAYLLQDIPIGLKPLAFRLCGMKMKSYKEMVAPAFAEKGVDYLITVSGDNWPSPGGKKKTIGQRAARILNDYLGDPSTDITARWSGVDIRATAEERHGGMPEAFLSDIPLGDAIYYSARDADAAGRVWGCLRSRIEKERLWDVLALDQSVIEMVSDMREGGMLVDNDALDDLDHLYCIEMDELEQGIGHMTGREINPGSPLQVRKLLYDTLHLPRRRGKKSDSTDADTLTMIQHEHPVIPKIIEWRQGKKMQTSFITPIRREQSPDGRLRPDFTITRTVTGRLACKTLNMMGIPIRTAKSRRIRDCFVAQDGFTLVSGDYSQIEMRFAAHESGDKNLCRVFNKGRDIHSQTASDIFGIPINRLDPMKHRRPAKTVGFGVLYQQSPMGLAEELASLGLTDWPVDKCADFIKQWYRIYPGVRKRFDLIRQEAIREGTTRDYWGRLRRLPEVHAGNKHIQEKGLREACSSFIQSGAQGVIKRAMADMTPVYRAFGKENCRPLLQIHDDLLWEVREDLVDEFAMMFKTIAENVVELKVPVLLDIKVGRKWGSMEERAI